VGSQAPRGSVRTSGCTAPPGLLQTASPPGGAAKIPLLVPLAPEPLAHRAGWREAPEPPYAVVPAGVRGAQLSWFAHDAINSPPEKTRREYRRACASEHLHPGLRPEHPLLIGGDDQRLLAWHLVRLCGDVPFAIEEQHPQKPAGSIEQMHRADANRAGAGKGRASRGRPGGVIARTAGPPNAKLRPRRGRQQARTSRDCLSPEPPLGQSEFLSSFEALAFPESAAGSSWLAY